MKKKSIRYVPIDYIKARIDGFTPEHFLKNELLRLTKPKTVFNGDTMTKTILEYKNLKVTIYENNNRIELSGSLHTFYNDGLHNYNDFGAREFNEVLRHLYNDLGISPYQLYLICLEWGYNVLLPFHVSYVLDSLLISKSVFVTIGKDNKLEGEYSCFKRSTFDLKIYNKGLHFKLGTELLRVEIKQKNWSKYRRQGIVTLEDFILADKTPFFEELLNQWSFVVMYDINNEKQSKYMKYESKKYWRFLRQNVSPKSFNYNRMKLKELNKQFGLNVQNRITELIIQKGNELQL